MNEEKFEDFEVIEEASTLEKVKNWCSENGSKLLDLVVAGVTLTGACIFSAATKRGVDDYLYTTSEDEVYRIPVKKMKTTKKEKEFVKKSI